LTQNTSTIIKLREGHGLENLPSNSKRHGNCSELADNECCRKIGHKHIETAFVKINGLKRDYTLKKLGDLRHALQERCYC
jgi:hypothetical protein